MKKGSQAACQHILNGARMTKNGKPEGLLLWGPKPPAIRKKQIIPYLKAKGLPSGFEGQTVLDF